MSINQEGVTSTLVGEATLLRRASEGDQDAFAKIFDQHVDTVYRFALRRTNSVGDAEDLTSIVFMTAWRRRAELGQLHTSLIAWLLVTTAKSAGNIARVRRRNEALVRRLAETRDRHGLVGGPESQEFRTELDDALRRLSTSDREILQLSLILDLSYEDIADVLGVPVGTVRSRLSRAKTRLRPLLDASALDSLSDPEGPSS